jgi:hypothetical protein
MARRPPGGWQTGARVAALRDIAYEPPDWCTVKWVSEAVAEVRHFRKASPTVPCCVLRVEVVERDHHGRDPNPRVNALHRADRYVERKHAR